MSAITFKARRGRAGNWAAMAGGVLLAMPVWGGPALAPGQSAPPLVARSFSGEAIDLAALHGQVVVLNFWASWCVPCRREMPLLEALHREYRDRGVTVLGLSADDRHDRRAAIQAAQAISYAAGMLDDATVNGFGAPPGLPLTYIISRAGTIGAILRAKQGSVSVEQLRAAIESQLKESS